MKDPCEQLCAGHLNTAVDGTSKVKCEYCGRTTILFARAMGFHYWVPEERDSQNDMVNKFMRLNATAGFDAQL